MRFVTHRKHTYGASTACYRDSFTVLCVDDVCTAQETPVDLYSLLTGIALLFYVYMMFVPHRKHTYGPLQPVTGIALLFYM
jgi:hypothetical protein